MSHKIADVFSIVENRGYPFIMQDFAFGGEIKLWLLFLFAYSWYNTSSYSARYKTPKCFLCTAPNYRILWTQLNVKVEKHCEFIFNQSGIKGLI